MPLNFPAPEEDAERPLIPIVLFPNNGGGYGYGITDQGFQTRSGFALPDGYDRTINMTCVDGRVVSPSFANEGPSGISSYAPFGFAIPWYDNSAIPVPTLHIGTAAAAITYKNGATSSDTISLTGFFSDGGLHDNAGTALLYAGVVTSLATRAAGLLARRTSAGTWTQDADVSAKYIASIAGALWRASSDYQVSKCPAGSDPFTLGSWGASFQVGTNDAKITSLGGIGAVPVVGKEDGIYQFVEADSRFNPLLKMNPHPRNFPVMRPDGIGGLLTSTYDGRLVHINAYGSVTVFDPLKGKAPGRDTPRNPIADMVAVGDDVYCLTSGSALTLQGAAAATLNALKTTDNFGTFTSYVTEGDDKSQASVIDISSLDTLANGDALLIGFSHPFLAVEFNMVTLNGNAATISTAFSTGAGTWTSIDNKDETNAFTVSGRIMLDAGATDISTNWVKATYNSLERYWLRIVTSAALDATTTIGEIAILPYRVGPNFTTTQLNYSEHMEASGAYGKIIRFRGLTGGQAVWDDIYTVPTTSASRIAATPLPSRATPRGSLIAIGHGVVVQYALPQGATPVTMNFPMLSRDSDDSGLNVAIPPVFYPSAVDMSGFYELAYLDVYGNNMVRGTDTIAAAARMDDTNPWYVTDTMSEDHCVFRMGTDEAMVGTTLHTSFQLLDGAATDPIGPSIRAIVAWVREAEYKDIPQATRTTPEVS